MVKNQLFRVLPDMEIINSLLEAFGLSSLNDTKFFTKDSLQENETIIKISDMKHELEKYYLLYKLQKLYYKKYIRYRRRGLVRILVAPGVWKYSRKNQLKKQIRVI